MTDTYERFVEILTTQFQVEPDEIRPDVTFEDLELDSLFMVELVLVLQKELGVKLGDDATPRITLNSMVKLIENELAQAR
jgi:acyl carrier protein